MEPIVYTEYEVVDQVSNKRFFTESREEALGYFEKEWFVVERHITRRRYTLFDEVELALKTNWNNNPDFIGE